MNVDDPVLKCSKGELYRVDGEQKYILVKDLLRIYDWVPYTLDLPENCSETTLTNEGFKIISGNVSKDSEHNISSVESGWIVNDSGGFTVASDSSDPFVSTTHYAVRSFDDWVPENSQQRRFKDMIQNLESKAMEEEDEHRFAQGSATGDFRNPI